MWISHKEWIHFSISISLTALSHWLNLDHVTISELIKETDCSEASQVLTDSEFTYTTDLHIFKNLIFKFKWWPRVLFSKFGDPMWKEIRCLLGGGGGEQWAQFYEWESMLKFREGKSWGQETRNVRLLGTELEKDDFKYVSLADMPYPQFPWGTVNRVQFSPGFPGGSDGKESAMQETWVQSLGWEDPLEKGMATHSSILAWRIPWTEEPGGLSPWGRKESDPTEWLTLCELRAV